MNKKLPLRLAHSLELFKKLCANHCQRRSTRRRESQLQCICRNYEAGCKQLVLFSKCILQTPFIIELTNYEKTHAAINKRMFKRLGHITDQFYKVELAKSEIKHKLAIIVGIFTLQYAMLGMLLLCYIFFRKFANLSSMSR